MFFIIDSYWREVTLVYPDEEITVVLPAPIVAKLQEGDMKLMAEIKKNIKETGAPLPACPATEEKQNETLFVRVYHLVQNSIQAVRKHQSQVLNRILTQAHLRKICPKCGVRKTHNFYFMKE